VLKKVIPIYKPIGYSPVQFINECKIHNPEYLNEKISPAGKLDPLAHGVIVLLIGEENKKRRDYEKSIKEYEFRFILGFSTDSYDICGIPKIGNSTKMLSRKALNDILNTFTGKQIQEFPPFSSYKIKGKPLFKYARDGTLNSIKIPKKEINIKDIKLIDLEKINGKSLYIDIVDRIIKLKGDYRQEDILKSWENAINCTKTYPLITAKATVSSGTYIRGIVNNIGIKLGCSATTIEILRTKSGNYSLSDLI